MPLFQRLLLLRSFSHLSAAVVSSKSLSFYSILDFIQSALSVAILSTSSSADLLSTNPNHFSILVAKFVSLTYSSRRSYYHSRSILASCPELVSLTASADHAAVHVHFAQL